MELLLSYLWVFYSFIHSFTGSTNIYMPGFLPGSEEAPESEEAPPPTSHIVKESGQINRHE